VARHDAGLLVVPRGVAGQLQDLYSSDDNEIRTDRIRSKMAQKPKPTGKPDQETRMKEERGEIREIRTSAARYSRTAAR
jgi:hypothetical protein